MTRDEKFILDEYRAHGLEPRRTSDGRLISLMLAQYLDRIAMTDQQATDEAAKIISEAAK